MTKKNLGDLCLGAVSFDYGRPKYDGGKNKTLHNLLISLMCF